MPLVQAVNGYGQTIDRSVARPFGYGRGLFTVDSAYSPYISGRYAPVRVSYQGNTVAEVRQRAGREVRTDGTEVEAPLVSQPEAGGEDYAQGERRKQERNQVLRDALGNPISPPPGVRAVTPAPGAGLGRDVGTGATAGATAGVTAGVTAGATTSAARVPGTRTAGDNPAARGAGVGASATSGLQGLPKGVRSTLGPSQWLMDASYMQTVRDAAVDQYVSKNNEWARGKGVPLGIPGESKYKGISKTDALASMVQVVPRAYTGPRPATPAGLSPGHPAYDRATRGQLVEYQSFTPQFTAQSANNAYWDLGLWRGNGDEIANWKRTFNALGLYAENTRPNLSSAGWGYYENAAMAEFMKIANSNPEAYQSVADLPKLRADLLDIAQREAASGGGATGGQSFPYTQRQTSTNVSISNLEDARETLRGRITDMIGRAPTDGEVRQFLGKLNNYERAHPTTTTTTTTYKDANNITVNSSGPNGDNLDPFNVVKEFAEKTGDYHAYQQLKYYQGLSDIMGSPQNTKAIPEVG